MHFFISKTFISNARPKLAKNQANAQQNPEVELLLLENYSHSLSTLRISERTSVSVFMKLYD